MDAIEREHACHHSGLFLQWNAHSSREKHDCSIHCLGLCVHLSSWQRGGFCLRLGLHLDDKGLSILRVDGERPWEEVPCVSCGTI